MSFVSPEFALLCLVFLPIYWSLAEHPRAQRSLLIVSAYGLYATWVPVFAWVLLAYSTVIWALGRWMQRAGAGRLPWVLGLWLAGSFLVFLKYYEFARETFQTLLQLTGFVSLLPVADWVAPVGVSFFTFQAVSYLVMVGRAPALARSWPDVLLFLSFWPTLFAGPIWRAEHFFAQTDDTDPARRVGRPRHAWLALYLITLGLLQKVVLASWLSAQVVDPVYKYPDQYASVSLAAAMLGYSGEEMQGLHVSDWDAHYSAAEVRAIIQTMGPAGEFLQTVHRRKDGSTYDAEVSISLATWGDKTFVFMLQRDISERKVVEAELEQYRRDLEILVGQLVQHYLMVLTK